MNIEPLELRIAPATVVYPYNDADGDLVTITATLPGNAQAPLDETDLTFVGGGTSGQLSRLNLTEAGFDGAKIIFTVTKKPGGDGLGHIGFIDATGVDLDRVIIKGDLGKIVAGDSTTANDPGLNLLQTRTMGVYGLVTQGGTGDLNSKITGKLGALKIAGDLMDAWVDVIAATAGDAQLGSVTIKGDVVGGLPDNSGRVSSAGAMDFVKIGGSIIGGDGPGTGQIFSSTLLRDVRIGGDIVGSSAIYGGQVATFGAIESLRIAGSVIGGAGQESGLIFSSGANKFVQIGRNLIGNSGDYSGAIIAGGALGTVLIGGDVLGGTGDFGGGVSSVSSIGTVVVKGDVRGGAGTDTGRIIGISLASAQVGGDVIGGPNNSTGVIKAFGPMGPVRIGGDLIGGSIVGDLSATDSGAIVSTDRITSVTIGGSLIAGNDSSTGALISSGAIVATYDIGPIKIGRSILGDPTNPAVISATGQEIKPATGFDIAIASITVGHGVRDARILAGFYNLTPPLPANADASIGPVKVGRNWISSSIVAGALDSGADGFGINDSVQPGGLPALVARIASVTIKGEVYGSYSASDNFGFVAQQIEKFKVGGRTFLLALGPGSLADNFLLPGTDDVHLLEV